MAGKKNNAVAKPLSLSDKIWSELTGMLLLLLAIYLVAAMASFNAGAERNPGGPLGSSISSGFFGLLGLIGLSCLCCWLWSASI